MTRDIMDDTIAGTILHLANRIESLLKQGCSDPKQRILVALAGVPGSGKSTVSQALLLKLAARGVKDVAVVPMDGFHYSRKTLTSFADPVKSFQRRGAPFTFDAPAFVALVENISKLPVTEPGEAQQHLYAPGFDHATQDPIEDAIPISSQNRLIIIEGNYTLLDQEPWKQVTALCREKWFVDVPPAVVLDRLVQRHLAAGIETDIEESIARVKENDLVNGDLIRSFLITPDIVIEN